MAEGLQTAAGEPIATAPAYADVSAGTADFARLQARLAESADASADVTIAAPPDRSDESDKPKRTRNRPPRSVREASPKPSKPAPQPATPEVQAARKQNATETAQMLGSVLVVAGKGTNSTALRADGYILVNGAEALGEAAAEVAKYDPTIARLLDKSAGGKVTAWLGLFGVAMSLGAQIATNHGLVQPGMMGSVAPQDIVDAFEKPAEEPTGEPGNVPDPVNA